MASVADGEPLSEPIGAGKNQYDDEAHAGDTSSPGGAQVRLLVRRASATALLTVSSGRFWWESAAILGLCAGSGTLMVIALVTGGDLPPESHAWVYMLTAAMLVLVSCVLAVRWGNGRSGAGQDPVEGAVDGPMLDWACSSAKGLLFASVSVVFLLLLALWSESAPAVAGVTYVLMMLEVMVFGRHRRGRCPVVRRSVGKGSGLGRRSFASGGQRSPEFHGIAEIYHTERIFWMATSDPMVILALVAGEAKHKENALDWLPGELQNAAEGTQVPCGGAGTGKGRR
ncbi:hypothetical protein [Pseudarthrobacter sp. SSS035]|uniref:hypothetical protein n=1 Tax=Pseudarthrobacter sp. SSS035 TaxID=2931399 RepID=UPI00200E5D09|nr:hypothetical protein [Pseudarthrobacter sp. SSS035]